MKRILLLLIILLGITTNSFAQTYTMSNTTETTCSGTFYDPGGTGNYANSQDFTMTFCSGTSQQVILNFTSFATESGWDYLYIYDGTSTAASLLGSFTGTGSPGTISSSNGCLTLRFTSDGSVTAAGFAATISCGTIVPVTNYLVSGSGQVNGCDGNVLDPGGTGNYANNQDFTRTFCSGTGNPINLNFTQFILENNFDYLYIYDGTSTASTLLGTYTGSNSPGSVTASSGCITLRFTSDVSVTYAGFSASISCITTPCTTPVITPDAPTTFCAGGSVGLSVPPSPPTNNGEFAVTISSGSFLDEVSWSITNSLGVIGASGGNYSIGSSNNINATLTNGPFVFNIESQGAFNDNTPTYTVTCVTSGTVLATGTLTGGTSFTSGSLACTGAQSISNVWSPAAGLNTTNGNNVIATPTTTTTYTVTSTEVSTGCVTTNNITVTVTPGPVAAASPTSQTICSGQATNINLTSVPTGATFNWTVVQNGVSGATSGSGSSIAQTLSLTGSTTGTATYTITPSAGGCTGNPITVTITVNPSVTPTFTQIPSVCSGGTFTLPTSSLEGVTGTWSPAVNTSATTTYTFTPNAGQCANTATMTVAVGAGLDFVNTQFPASATICQGSSVSIFGQVYEPNLTETNSQAPGIVAEYGVFTSNTDPATWPASAWSTATYNPLSLLNPSNDEYSGNVTGLTPGTYYYAFRFSLNGCSFQYGGYSATGGGFWDGTSNVNGVITVNPNSTPTFTQVTPICSGTTLAPLPTTSLEGIAGSWSPVIDNTTTTTYTFTPNTGLCATASTTMTIVVNTTPIVTATPNSQSLCSGNQAAISLSSTPSGATFNWSVVQTNVTGAIAGNGNSISDFLNNNSTSVGNATYTIIPTLAGCVGSSITVPITVNPLPTASATPLSQTICSGSTTSIVLSSVPTGASFSWTTIENLASGSSAGSGSTINQTLTATTSATGTVTYSVTPNYNTCNGSPINVVVSIGSNPVVTATPNSQSICSGTATSINLTSSPAGATFNWSVSASGVSGAVLGNGNSINQTLYAISTSAGTASYTVTPNIGTCVGNPITVVIAVNPTPTVSASPSSQSICSGTSTNINLTSPVLGASFGWTTVETNAFGSTTGNGTSIAELLTATTSNTGSVSYTITPTANGCIGSPTTVTVLVNPSPVAVATPSSQSICSGTQTGISLSSTPAGATFSWTVIETGVVGASVGNSNSISQTLTATGGTTGTANYQITPTIGSCVGSPLTLVISVNPTPAVIASPSSQTVCSGTTPVINLSSTPAGATFGWTISQTGLSGALAGSGTVISQTLTATGPLVGNVTYAITPTLNGCAGSILNATIDVNPIPVVSATPTSQTICSGNTSSITLSSVPTGATFNWTATESFATGSSAGTGTSIAQVLTATTSNSGVVTYSITPTLNTCIGSPISVPISVAANPIAIATPAVQTICSGTNASIGLSSLPVGATFSWTVVESGVTGSSASSGSLIAQTLNSTGSTVGTATYTVTAAIGTCIGSPVDVIVTVNPNPTLISSPASESICSGSTSNLLLTSNPTGASFTWTVNQVGSSGASAGTGSAIAQNLTVTGLVAGSATYTVTPSLFGCTGTPTDIIVSVNPTPTASASPTSSTICSGFAPTINLASSPAGATFDWTVNQNGVSGASNATGNIINQVLTTVGIAQGTADYTIIPTLGTCIGQPIVASISVNPIPSVLASPTNETICSGTTTNISLTSSPAGATFDWTTIETNASGSSLGTGSSIAQILTATTTNVGNVDYVITPTLASCVGSPMTVSVSVNPIPTAVATPALQTICSGTATSIDLTSIPSGATFAWSIAENLVANGFASTGSTIAQVLNSTVSAQGDATYTITPTLNNCIGSPIDVVITVNPNPVATSTPASQTICSGFNTALDLTSAPTGATFDWTVIESGVQGASANNGSTIAQTLTNSNLVPGTATYTVTPTLLGCVGSPINVVVTVNPIPVAIANPTSQTICGGTSTGISLSSSPVGSTFDWTVSENGTSGASASSGSLINQILDVTTLVSGTTVYSITPTLAGCVGSPLDVTINVDPTPVAIATPTSQIICSNTASLIDLTSSPVGSTYTWSVIQTGTSGATNGSGSSIAQTLQTTGLVQGNALYSVIPTLGVCSGSALDVTIYVNPIPTATATPTTQTICSGTAPSINLSSVPAGATFDWTTVENGASGSSIASGNTIAQVLTTTAQTAGTVTYSVIPTLAGCSGPAVNATITINPLPIVTATPSDQTICNNTSTSIYLTSDPASATFTWIEDPNGTSGGAAGVGDSIFQVLSTLTGGFEKYTITPQLNGCFGNSLDVIVNVILNPVVSITPAAPVICANETVTLTGNGALTYTWSPTLGLNDSIGTSVDATLASTQTITVTGTDAAGCSSNASATITVNPFPVLTVSPDITICENSSTELIVSGANSYVWSPNSDLNTTLGDTVVADPITTTTYTVIGTTLNCSTPATVTVTVNPAPIINAGNDIALCQGEAMSLNGSGGVSYTWNNGVQDGVPFVPQTTTTYVVTGTGLNLCTAMDSIVVTITPLPIINITPSKTGGCAPDIVEFENQTIGAAYYHWDFGDGDTSNVLDPAHTYDSTGCYDVTLVASTLNGCFSTMVYPSLECFELAPIASFFADPTRISTQNPVSTMINNSIYADSYSWDFNDGTPISYEITPTHTFPSDAISTYEVTLVAYSPAGCTDTARTFINVFEDVVYFIPNTFTPDGDSYNQTFKPVFVSGYDPYDFTMLIYDRWGEVIFESHDVTAGWSGSYGEGNDIVKDGTYSWTIEFKIPQTGERKNIQGHVNVLR